MHQHQACFGSGQARLCSCIFVDEVALPLQEQASGIFESKSLALQEHLAIHDLHVSPRVTIGGPGEKSKLGHQYIAPMLEAAHRNGHAVNLNKPRYSVGITVDTSAATRLPQLVFVVSLQHAVGLPSGLMFASAFAEIAENRDIGTESEKGGDTGDSKSFKDCTLQPFFFTWENDPNRLRARFDRWLEERLSVALRYWGEFL